MTQTQPTAPEAGDLISRAAALTGLLPCPFCGGMPRRHTLSEDEFGNRGGDVIECATCQASSRVEFGTKENLIDAWNRRSLPAAQPDGQGAVPVTQEPMSWPGPGRFTDQPARLRRAAEIAAGAEVTADQAAWISDVLEDAALKIEALERESKTSATLAPVSAGDLDALVANAQALLDIDASGAMVPHGIGGLARGVITDLLKGVAALRATAEPVTGGEGGAA